MTLINTSCSKKIPQWARKIRSCLRRCPNHHTLQYLFYYHHYDRHPSNAYAPHFEAGQLYAQKWVILKLSSGYSIRWYRLFGPKCCFFGPKTIFVYILQFFDGTPKFLCWSCCLTSSFVGAKNAYYSIASHGVVWYCMELHCFTWHCKFIVWYCML